MHGIWHTHLSSTERSSFTEWCSPSGQMKYASLRPQVWVNRCRGHLSHSHKERKKKENLWQAVGLYLAFRCKSACLFIPDNSPWYSAFTVENISCIIWFVLLLDEGMDTLSHHTEWPLPSGTEPGRPDFLSLLPETMYLSCWLGVQWVLLGPKGTQTSLGT